MKRDFLVNIFRYHLSRPPCRSGLRLLSEPELAVRFKANRPMIRRVLLVLEQDGLLVRRHGSGTFVRKPLLEPVATPLAGLEAGSIFAQEQLPMHGVADAPLRIGVSCDFAKTNPVSAKIFQAVTAYLQEYGHQPVEFYQYRLSSPDDPTDADQEAEFTRTACDGYLLEYFWSQRDQAALRRVFPGRHIPCVYFWTASIASDGMDILMQNNTNEAVHRAVNLFYQHGYRRIALLTMNARTNSAYSRIQRYQQSLSANKLEYQEVITINRMAPHQLYDSLHLLFQRNPPDAIYSSDDSFIPELLHFFRDHHIEPGQDVGVITLSNRDIPVPDAPGICRLEFDPSEIGHLAAHNLLRRLTRAGEYPAPCTLQARWIPGNSVVQHDPSTRGWWHER